ncbi:MAG: MFS transporter [Betaproteobacteria bacterium]|nr:MFS transporter [Betaproteobacteria bacterium]
MSAPGGGPRPFPPAALGWSIWGLGALLYLVGFYQRVAPAVITDRLMTEFSLGAAALGNLSAFYFYSYAAMQIPTGVLADRWGPRRLLVGGAAVATLGTAVFAAAPTLAWANGGRLLIGASVAVAFVSMLKLATRWFHARHFVLASGLALATGILGAVLAGVPLRILVEAFGWRAVMWGSAALTGLLCAAIWLRVRDDPAQMGYASHAPGHAGPGGAHRSVGHDIAHVFGYRNTWLLLLTPFGVAGAMLTFGGLWGVPYLSQVYGLGKKEAAAITSAMLVAWAVGGPLLGALSQRMGRRKPLYVGTTAVALAGWCLIAFLPPLPLPALVALLLVLGFVSGSLIIGFAFTKESVPLHLAGTASGICNMGPLLGGAVLQPVVGLVLDARWNGALEAGARIYDAGAWQAGFVVMTACIAASLVLVSLTRETHCRQAM